MKLETLKLLVPMVAVTIQSNSASTIIPPYLGAASLRGFTMQRATWETSWAPSIGGLIAHATGVVGVFVVGSLGSTILFVLAIWGLTHARKE
jgi:hypothetical protein